MSSTVQFTNMKKFTAPKSFTLYNLDIRRRQDALGHSGIGKSFVFLFFFLRVIANSFLLGIVEQVGFKEEFE